MVLCIKEISLYILSIYMISAAKYIQHYNLNAPLSALVPSELTHPCYSICIQNT